MLVLKSLIMLAQFALNAYMWVIIAAALISWVQPNPYNPIVRLLDRLASPAYKAVSRIPTRIGNVDLAPLLIILALQFLSILLGNLSATWFSF